MVFLGDANPAVLAGLGPCLVLLEVRLAIEYSLLAGEALDSLC